MRKSHGVIAGCLLALFTGPSLGAAPANNAAIPDFSGMTTGWLAMGTDFKQVPGAPPMVTNDDAHPHVGNGGGRQSSFRFADLNNPNLTEFAKASLKKTNDEVLRGKAVFSREARCWPTGVPTYDLNQAQPVYFIQTPKEVVMMWQMDHQIRHVYLDVPHSKNPKPSWYGESVGYYERDELVVDTIGLNDKTFVDNYRTPHTTQMHVVERYKMLDAGKALQVTVAVEDPGAFTMPWSARQVWRRVNAGMLIEEYCEPNNAFYFGYDVAPLPHAGSQMGPSKLSTESKARVASGGVG
jgi:hypothetical protein